MELNPSLIYTSEFMKSMLIPIMLMVYVPNFSALGLDMTSIMTFLRTMAGAYVMGYRVRMVVGLCCSYVPYVPDVVGFCSQENETHSITDLFAVLVFVFYGAFLFLRPILKERSIPSPTFEITSKDVTTEDVKGDVIIVGAGMAGACLGIW